MVQIRWVFVLIALINMTVAVAVHAITPCAGPGREKVGYIAHGRVLLALVGIVYYEVTIIAVNSSYRWISADSNLATADFRNMPRNICHCQDWLVDAAIRLLTTDALKARGRNRIGSGDASQTDWLVNHAFIDNQSVAIVGSELEECIVPGCALITIEGERYRGHTATISGRIG